MHEKPSKAAREPPHETFAPCRLDHDGHRRHRRGINGSCAKRLRSWGRRTADPRPGRAARPELRRNLWRLRWRVAAISRAWARPRAWCRLGRPMQRITCPERDDWRIAADETGFDFHTIDDERYWDERAYYAFTLDEIERRIEEPTGEIDAMCLELVARAIDDESYLHRLKIPEAFWPLIAESWYRDEASLNGRLDFCF